MTSFTLVIPHLPPSELFPNRLRSIHWTKRAQIEREAREEGYYEALAIKPHNYIAPEYAEVSYLFVISDRRIRDIEAMLIACKPYIDSLVDAGILLKDDCFHLRIGGARVAQGAKQTVLTIKEVKE